jgi:hypothetical protein
LGTTIQEDKMKFRNAVQVDKDKSPGTLLLGYKNKSV